MMDHQTKSGKIFLSLILFFLFVFSVSAYKHLGSENQQFLTGNSVFDSEANVTINIRSPTAVLLTPTLIYDIDNDNIEEVVVMTSVGFEIYTLPSLALEKTFVHNASVLATKAAQDFTLVDIDDDDILEIVAVYHTQGAGAQVVFYEWNGSRMAEQTIKPGPNPASNTRNAMIECDDTENTCLSVFWETDGTNCQIIAIGLNASNSAGDQDGDAIDGLTIFSNLAASGCGCVNTLRETTVVDYDADLINEYIFSWLEIDDSGNEDAKGTIIYVYTSESSQSVNMTLESTLTDDTGNYLSNACVDNLISPALVMSIDQVNEAKLEVLIGHSEFGIGKDDDYGFVISVWDEDGNLLDTHPEATTVDGQFIGNLNVWNGFSGLDKDYCLQVYSDDNQELRLLCGSRYLSGFFGFNQDVTSVYEYSGFNQTQELLTHSINIDSDNTYEIINSYGSFQVNINDEELTREYIISPQNVWVEVIDDDTSDNWQLMSYDDSTLRYYTSEPIQYGCLDQINCYSGITINPSSQQCWNTNSTVEIRVTVNDFDDDDVQVNVVLYANNSNFQESGWSENITDESTVIMVYDNEGEQFIANLTGNNYRLLIQLRDTDKPDQVESVEKFFTVADTGCINPGEVIETITGETGVESVDTTFNDVEINQNTTPVNRGLVQIAGLLGVSVSVIFYFVMLVINYFMWTESASIFGRNNKPEITIGAIILLDVLGTFIGVRLGIISFGVILVMLVISIAVIAVFFRKMFTSTGTGG